MHGMIMVQFQRFVSDRIGPGAWDTVREMSGLPRKLYVAVEAYPDEDLSRLLAATREFPRTRCW
ncbi:MAG: heme NO-binding domain-containing protein [Candidatus Eisenbacteria bacterium]